MHIYCDVNDDEELQLNTAFGVQETDDEASVIEISDTEED